MINGSHLETMRELLAIYESQEDKQNIRKYSEKIRLIDEYDADDERSMADNNTSCFNFRLVSDTNTVVARSFCRRVWEDKSPARD